MDEFRAHFFKQLAHRFIATRRSDADAFIAQDSLTLMPLLRICAKIQPRFDLSRWWRR
ncbi:hypothetical protein LTSEALA_1370 [Salmonella enterica subsp. enterica serovar Alachua str. R6-377]|uniref:Uncharacterized protein n=1 Tax=Salmonella enterica subsp. enterica serovar Alachua str. R6-377 TaxID=913241 RepID=G5LLL5_SALET|nr:hypothetical protein LTSEALA_1370 [Salmonella enterica subsp. enterica serovar Alachua str. R6-377]